MAMRNNYDGLTDRFHYMNLGLHRTLAILLSALTMGAHGANWYVATNGNNGAHTSWSSAYTNIQDALSAAQSNDTIHVAGHLFKLTNSVRWLSGASHVTLRGGYAATNDAVLPGTRDPDRWPTVLARRYGASAPYFHVMTVDRVTNGVMDSVTLTGGYKNSSVGGDGGGGLDVLRCQNLRVVSCIVTGNLATKGGTYGEVLGGGIRTTNSTVLVTNSIVKFNEARGCSGGYALGGGLAAILGSMTVVDTVISGNKAWGYLNAYGNDGGGVYNKNGAVRLHNCLVTGNRATERGSAAANASGTMNLSNCTLANNARDGIFRGGGTVTATNSILWGNGDDVTGGIALAWCNIQDGDSNGVKGCISVEPKFQRGYYLAADSLCVNAGTNNAGDWGLSERTTRTDGTLDTARVDLGWHYAGGLGSLEFHVSPSGTDTNTGLDWAHALRSVTAAVRLAGNGTRINLASGTYNPSVETFPISVINKTGLELVGTNMVDTVLDATGSGKRALFVSADGVRLAGITVKGGSFTTADKESGGGGLLVHAAGGVVIASSTIKENTCTMSGTYGVTHGGGMLSWDSDVLVTNCTVSYNKSQGCSGGYAFGGGLSTLNGHLTVVDSIIKQNEALGAANATYVWGGGLFNWGGVVRLHNGVLTGNKAYTANPGKDSGSAISDYAGVISVSSLYHGMNRGTVRTAAGNCTIVNNSLHGVRASPGPGTLAVTNSILWSNGDDVTGSVALVYCNVEDGDNNGTNGCFSLDPELTSGYYLADDSPCVDTGTNTASYWGLGGYTTRVDGSNDTGRVDIGWHYQQGLGSYELYVSTTGDDGFAGTNWTTALRTITTALTKALDGTRIYLAAGSYTHPSETFPLTISGVTGVRIIGTNAATTVINAAGANKRAISIAADGVRLEHLTIRGGNLTAANNADGGGISVVGCNDVQFLSCVITNNLCNETLTGAVTRGGGIHAMNSSLTVSDCRIVNNQAVSGSGGKAQGSGLCVENGSAVISRTRFAANAASGWANATFIGTALYNVGGVVRVDNSLFSRNTTTKLAGGVYNESGTMGLINCTVVTNSSPGVQRAGGTFAVTNGILWWNGDDVSGTVSVAFCDIEDGDNNGMDGCISLNPLFQGPATNDFRLLKDTPCGNRGKPIAWLADALDLAGDIRVKGGRIDMGCYESDAASGGTLFMLR